MRHWTKFIVAAVLLTASPALAREPFFIAGSAPANQYPGAPKAVSDDSSAAPYAMNYSEEAAANLGVHNGQMDVFSAHPGDDQPYLPSVSGGVGSEGAMLKLQWHPGY
jgi:hypothetical protein